MEISKEITTPGNSAEESTVAMSSAIGIRILDQHARSRSLVKTPTDLGENVDIFWVDEHQFLTEN